MTYILKLVIYIVEKIVQEVFNVYYTIWNKNIKRNKRTVTKSYRESCLTVRGVSPLVKVKTTKMIKPLLIYICKKKDCVLKRVLVTDLVQYKQ